MEQALKQATEETHKKINHGMEPVAFQKEMGRLEVLG